MGILTDIIKELPLSALLREKLQELEKNYEKLEEENIKLKDENCSLRQNFDELSQQVKQNEDDNKQPEQSELNEDSERVLKVLFDAGHELSIQHIASAISKDISTTQYHVDILVDRGLVLPSRQEYHLISEESTQYYSLDIDGRAYVIEKLNK